MANTWFIVLESIGAWKPSESSRKGVFTQPILAIEAVHVWRALVWAAQHIAHGLLQWAQCLYTIVCRIHTGTMSEWWQMMGLIQSPTKTLTQSCQHLCGVFRASLCVFSLAPAPWRAHLRHTCRPFNMPKLHLVSTPLTSQCLCCLIHHPGHCPYVHQHTYYYIHLHPNLLISEMAYNHNMLPFYCQ